jgi:mutator protein MutT
VIEVVCAIVVDGDRVLLVQRPPGGRHGGLWEFPGGKVEAGETHAQALARELEEELGIAAEVGSRLAEAEDDVIRLVAFRVERFRGAIDLRVHGAQRWVAPRREAPPPMPRADREIWARVVEMALS